MFTAGFLAAAVLVAPVFFALGVFAARDRRTDREPRYVGPALRRSVR